MAMNPGLGQSLNYESRRMQLCLAAYELPDSSMRQKLV